MRILVIGGTGTIGSEIVKMLSPDNDVMVFSRDEYKQFWLKKRTRNVIFSIGDIRDVDKIFSVVRGFDYVIHAAAMKHVSICEGQPMEAVKTNITGTRNVVEACVAGGVKKLLFVSTDKACEADNVYGATKLIADKIVLNGNKDRSGVKCSIVRFGNILGSRGSLVEVLKRGLYEPGAPFYITSKDVTRFFLTCQDAARITIESLSVMEGGETFVMKLPAFNLGTLMEAYPEMNYQVSGLQEGEKVHEVLLTEPESVRAIEWQDHYVIKDRVVRDEPFRYSSEMANLVDKETLRKVIDGLDLYEQIPCF